MFSLQIRDVQQIKASIPSSSMPCPHLCSGDPSSIPKAEKKSFCSGTRGRSDVLVARLLALTAGIIFRDYLSVAVINRADVENNYTNRHVLCSDSHTNPSFTSGCVSHSSYHSSHSLPTLWVWKWQRLAPLLDWPQAESPDFRFFGA